MWKITPVAEDHARFAWNGGEFETASRRHTPEVEGTIRSDGNLVMVTLEGGARVHEFATEDGLRFKGQDRKGSASFLPAGCERRLFLRDVSWRWATISLPDDPSLDLPKHAFAGQTDIFLAGMFGQFRQVLQEDGVIDPLYCDSMKLALVQYLRHRGRGSGADSGRSGGLTPRQLRAVSDFVEAGLSDSIRIAEMALVANLSEGYFHRAFRSSTGQTPLAFITGRRVSRAAELLDRTDLTVAAIALEAGFQGQSHFTRTFKSLMGVTPSGYRQAR